MTYEPYPGGGAGGYQPFPGGTQTPPAQHDPAPPSVINAVRLMYAGAVVSLVVVILNLATAGSLKTTIHNNDKTLTSTQVTNLAHFEIGAIVVLGLLGVGLWIWMALKCKAGRNWARVTGSTLFGIFTVLLIISLARVSGSAGLIVNVVLWLIGLGTVVLLWRKDSSLFFRRTQY